ncbi:Lpg1974 family pore-forming outer membrane protein [Candidatus Neptunochlamydia vexilliferae]|uniref:MOMP-like family protein n=1 Tax=Candidatus Neptunichlamydia vexilliferae TaxID=1651774 RepID=A0ABS0AYV7_9BACT|nr:Lpg1974 family pore-forming outer membrane protein [Candidatus Neptunochlamydia vexilliferae]MBF5059296.1 hypothetical protein [Candidatus Neptunochlamydia vexilliferae]
MKWKISLIFLALPLIGAEIEERITALEEQMGQVGEQTADAGYGARFAPTGFTRGSAGVEFFGGALYWHAKVGGTEYVYSLINQARGQKGRVASQRFDWDFGYRIGAGVRIPLVSWEIVGTYTHYGSQDHEGRGVPPPSLLINLKGEGIVSSQRATSSYKIDYDKIVLEIKRSSFLSRLFGLGTTIGLKQSWIDQTQKVTYKPEVFKVKDRCRFRGLGPRIGLNAKWHLFSGISLLTDIAAALQYGDFEVKHAENKVDLKGDTHIFSSSIDFFMGLQWEKPKEWYQWSLRLGYEAEYYWRLNKSVEIENAIGTGNAVRFQLIRYADDLTFYGVTMRSGIEF